jgi:hypothetical protein
MGALYLRLKADGSPCSHVLKIKIIVPIGPLICIKQRRLEVLIISNARDTLHRTQLLIIDFFWNIAFID